MPFIVRWPGVVKAGTRCDQLALQADLIATCAELTGAELPADAGEDSVSLLPLLRGGAQPVRETAVMQSAKGLMAIRRGPWKLIFGPGSGGLSKGRDDQPAQLYHLADDVAKADKRSAGDAGDEKSCTRPIRPARMRRDPGVARGGRRGRRRNDQAQHPPHPR